MEQISIAGYTVEGSQLPVEQFKVRFGRGIDRCFSYYGRVGDLVELLHKAYPESSIFWTDYDIKVRLYIRGRRSARGFRSMGI